MKKIIWDFSAFQEDIQKSTAELTERLPVIPALITWIRILATGVVVLFLLGLISKFVLFWVILGAVLSDYFDGWLARRMHKVTYPGKVFDFIADKIFISVTLPILNVTMGKPDTYVVTILMSYHILILLVLAVISWSISFPVVTITKGEKLAVIFSYLVLIVISATDAFPEKQLFRTALMPVTIIAILSAVVALISYIRLVKRILSSIMGKKS